MTDTPVKPGPIPGSSSGTGQLTKGELGTTHLVAQSLAVGPITSAALLGGVVAARGVARVRSTC